LYWASEDDQEPDFNQNIRNYLSLLVSACETFSSEHSSSSSSSSADEVTSSEIATDGAVIALASFFDSQVEKLHQLINLAKKRKASLFKQEGYETAFINAATFLTSAIITELAIKNLSISLERLIDSHALLTIPADSALTLHSIFTQLLAAQRSAPAEVMQFITALKKPPQQVHESRKVIVYDTSINHIIPYDKMAGIKMPAAMKLLDFCLANVHRELSIPTITSPRSLPLIEQQILDYYTGERQAASKTPRSKAQFLLPQAILKVPAIKSLLNVKDDTPSTSVTGGYGHFDGRSDRVSSSLCRQKPIVPRFSMK
jgi:hypothetical protein